MLDLVSLPRRYLDQLGREKVAEIVGCSRATVAMWISRGTFPLVAVQKLLEFDPTPLHEIKPFYETPAPGTRLAIILPTTQPVELATMETIIPMFNQKEMVFRRFSFNSLYHVRNMAAEWFVYQSGCEWSYWSDRDMIHPCGDAELFKRLLREYTASNCPYPDVFAAAHSIYRLRFHDKKLIAACYFGRAQGIPAQFAGADAAHLRENLRHGPRNQIMAVPWVGFGSILIHRDVFLDIARTQESEVTVKNDFVRKRLGYRFSFFKPFDDDWGDDTSFCARAVKAGHQPYVDLSLMPGHVGMKAFTFADSAPRVA